MINYSEFASATAAKAFEIENTILLATEPITINELVKQTGVAQSLVSRIIQTMEMMDLVRRDQQTRGWIPSGRLDMMAGRMVRPLSLTQRCQQALAWLCEESNETTQLTVESRGKILTLDQWLGEQTIQVVGTVGRRVPMHSCAPGKVWLAFSTDEARIAWFQSHQNLKSYTPNTIVSRAALEEKLVAIRERGYAIDHEEGIVGIRCVAAPILNRSEKLEGALTVVAPKERMDVDQLKRLGQLAVQASERINW